MKLEDLSLSALKYFIDAVELESITLSAQKNHVSRPAVSQAIFRLEQWRGIALLEHEKRSFALTKAGREFYFVARSSFERMNDEFLKKSSTSKELKIGCSTSLLDLVFPKIKKNFSAAHNPVVKFGTTDQLVHCLKEGSINLAFVIDNEKHPTFRSFEFHQGFFHLISKTGNFENTLITTDDRPEVESFLKFTMKKKIVFQSHIRLEVWSLAAAFTQSTGGCCIVPDFILPAGLKSVRTNGWSAPYSARVFVRKMSELSPLEAEIVESLSLG